MVNARRSSLYNRSISMIIGVSPKIDYQCGKCGKVNSTRIAMKLIKANSPYVICQHCGVVNDLQLKYD